MTKLFIDDIRECPEGFSCARTSSDAIDWVKKNGCPDFISFDHDLGGEDTTMAFVNWFIGGVLDKEIVLPKDFRYNIHSANPVGSENLRSKLENLLAFLDGSEVIY